MKKEQKFIKRITWLTVSLVAGIHFLTAQVGIGEIVQQMVNMKTDLPGCISQPIPWKTMISIFIPAGIG